MIMQNMKHLRLMQVQKTGHKHMEKIISFTNKFHKIIWVHVSLNKKEVYNLLCQSFDNVPFLY